MAAKLSAVHPALFNAVCCITNSPAERTGLYGTAAARERLAARAHLIRALKNA
jgi:hypothetical protein